MKDHIKELIHAIKEYYPDSNSLFTYSTCGYKLMLYTSHPVSFEVNTGEIIDEGVFVLRLQRELNKARNNG